MTRTKNGELLHGVVRAAGIQIKKYIRKSRRTAKDVNGATAEQIDGRKGKEESFKEVLLYSEDLCNKE